MSSHNANTNSDEPLEPEVLPVNSTDARPVSDASQVSLQSIEATITHSGPLPSPWILRDYENACPGSAERIIAMAEGQANHRRDLERAVVLGNINNARLFAVLGTVIVLGSMVLAGYLALHGLSGAAIAVVLAELGTLAGVAMYRNYTKKEERVQKDKNRRQGKQKQIRPPANSDGSTSTEPSEED